jgi:hypothetical protein
VLKYLRLSALDNPATYEFLQRSSDALRWSSRVNGLLEICCSTRQKGRCLQLNPASIRSISTGKQMHFEEVQLEDEFNAKQQSSRYAYVDLRVIGGAAFTARLWAVSSKDRT